MMLVERSRQRLQNRSMRSERDTLKRCLSLLVDCCLSRDGFVEGRLTCDSTI